MSIDTAAILAARYHSDPSPLKAAVLGQGGADINPYAALRALQLQKEAERYKMAEAAMNGQQQQPSLVQQALQGAQGSTQRPQGLPGMQQPQQMPQQPQMQQPSPGLAGMPAPEGEYAGGGIVAFANTGLVPPAQGGDELTPDMLEHLDDQIASLQENQDSPGHPVSHNAIANMLPQLLQNIKNTQYKEMTDQEWEDKFTKRKALLEKDAGPNPADELKTQLARLDEARAQKLEQAKGLAWLAAAGDVVEPGGLIRGVGRAGKTMASMHSQALAADDAEKRALLSMRFNIADAQRKEKMGLNNEAIRAADQARADHTAAQGFAMRKNQAIATVASGMARATKPTGTGGGVKGYDNLVSGLYGELKYKNDQLPEKDREPEAVLLAKAHREAAPMWAKVNAADTVGLKKEQNIIEGRKTDITGADSDTKFQEALIHWQTSDTARRKAIAEEQKKLRTDRSYITATPAEQERKRKEIEDKYPGVPKPTRGGTASTTSEPAFPNQSTSQTSAKAPAGNKNSQAKPTSGKVVSRADIAATAKASGKTVKQVEDAAKAKGYIIK
jgi:hypothetical protein